jgi:hypothetical protein
MMTWQAGMGGATSKGDMRNPPAPTWLSLPVCNARISVEKREKKDLHF